MHIHTEAAALLLLLLPFCLSRTYGKNDYLADCQCEKGVRQLHHSIVFV